MSTLANTQINGINFMGCDSRQDVEASEEQTGAAAALVVGWLASRNNTAAAHDPAHLRPATPEGLNHLNFIASVKINK